MITNEILVNMPDCTNLLFYITKEEIVKCKRISFAKSKNAIVFYNLTTEIQDKIWKFLNPKGTI